MQMLGQGDMEANSMGVSQSKAEECKRLHGVIVGWCV